MSQSDSLSPFQPPKKDVGSALAPPVNIQGDLIDLNTPKDDKGFVQPSAAKPKIPPSDLTIDGVAASSLDMPDGSVSQQICNSVSADDVSASNSLYVSHTESGYLTDSVTSSLSRDRHQSVGSELDKTPCQETSSETTPCRETSAAFADDTTPNNDMSRESFTQSLNGAVNDCTEENETGEALAKMDLNCDMKKADIENIFATNTVKSRPESLVLPSAGQKNPKSLRRSDSDSFRYGFVNKPSTNSYDNLKDYRKRSKSYGVPIPRQKEGVNILEEGLSKSLPHGQIMKSDAGLIEFIADDLEEKIRRSSPASKTASSTVSSRKSSLMSDSITSADSFTSSTMATSVTSRSYPQSPDCIPPIDPMAIHEIECQARLVADSLDLMMGNLRNNLHKMSAISVGCEEAYRTSVDVTCDSVDSSIKSMYALMAKCEELSSTMKPVYALADQIKEIKRLLDRFENQLVEKP